MHLSTSLPGILSNFFRTFPAAQEKTAGAPIFRGEDCISLLSTLSYTLLQFEHGRRLLFLVSGSPLVLNLPILFWTKSRALAAAFIFALSTKEIQTLKIDATALLLHFFLKACCCFFILILLTFLVVIGTNSNINSCSSP
jgi:hypothetical protein